MLDKIELRRSGCAFAFMFLIVPFLSDVQAQGVADFEIPNRESQVRASCDSKDMPRNGYDIADHIPGTNDCWWVKAAQAQEVRSDVDPGVVANPVRPNDLMFGSGTTFEEALAMADARHDAAMRYVSLERGNAEVRFALEASTCGEDASCYSRAVTALRTTRERLSGLERDATLQLFNDIGRIGDYFGDLSTK